MSLTYTESSGKVYKKELFTSVEFLHASEARAGPRVSPLPPAVLPGLQHPCPAKAQEDRCLGRHCSPHLAPCPPPPWTTPWGFRLEECKWEGP